MVIFKRHPVHILDRLVCKKFVLRSQESLDTVFKFLYRIPKNHDRIYETFLIGLILLEEAHIPVDSTVHVDNE